MNIKISIKDCECIPSMTNNQEISQVEFKKKTMLYAPPERDRNSKQTIKSKNNKINKKTNVNPNTEKYRQSEKQMLDALNKQNQNKVTIDMVQNSNNILQRQNEILSNNQKTLHDMMSNKNKNEQQIKNKDIENMNKKLDEIKIQVEELKKMKSQFLKEKQQFERGVAQQKSKPNEIPPHIAEMHANWKNQIKTSHNNIEVMNNIELVKDLQNFNIEAYHQALNSLKKQIMQYQKQSENIQKELKIRAAKLEKLDVLPKFQQQLYKPYQQHLSNRVKNIDLHAIKQKIYQKIGTFDYGKFEYDVGILLSQVKSQLGNFPLICQQHKILVPDIRINQKQIKNMEIRVPSVLDEYKLRRGIKFDEQNKQYQQKGNVPMKQPVVSRTAKTNQIQQRLKQTTRTKKPENLQKIRTKPIDLSNQVKLTKNDGKKQTIFENQEKKEKKKLEERINKKSPYQNKQDEDFNKYLENRAKQQLQLLYREKKERLQRMENELYQQITNPIFIDLDLDKQQIRRKKQRNLKQNENKKQLIKQQNQDDYSKEQFQKDDNGENKKQIIQEQLNNKKDNINIKEVGRQILKQKLKNLIGERNKYIRSTSQPQNVIHPNINNEQQVQNIAEGFINMINNTLTQVNNNLARTIQSKIQHNNQRRPTSLEQRSPKKLAIPQLEAFNPPPVFNMNLIKQPRGIPYIAVPPPVYQQPPEKKKIVVEDYEQYKIKESDYNQLIISSDDDDDDGDNI